LETIAASEIASGGFVLVGGESKWNLQTISPESSKALVTTRLPNGIKPFATPDHSSCYFLLTDITLDHCGKPSEPQWIIGQPSLQA
jgi:hypothetical protein